MHFLNCLHPVPVKQYGETIFVPCGKCDYCRYVRNKSMSQRLQLEMKYYKYALFFTLTYANTFVPKLVYNKDMNILLCDDSISLHGCEDSGMFIDCQYFSSHEYRHIHSLINKTGYVPYLRKSDLQLFTKRLRRNIDYYIVNRLLSHGKITDLQKKEFQIYYSYCGEYGPTNFRPHFHGILFFDSSILARSLPSLLRKSWSFGRVTSRYSSSAKDCEYISEYVNATYRLPEFYQRSWLRPFRLFSKSHPVGFPALNAKEISRIFYERSPYMVFEDTKGKLRQAPLWKSLEFQIFPRFVAYNQIPNYLKVRLINDALKFDNYVDYYNKRFNLDSLPFGDPNDTISDCSSLGVFYSLVIKGTKRRETTLRLRSSSLYSIYHAASIIHRNMNYFHVDSVSDYIKIIDQYVYNCQQFKLKNQQEFVQSFYADHPDWYQYLDLGSFSLNDILRNTTDMQSILADITYSIEHSHKNRSKHEFEAMFPDRSLNLQFNDGSFNGLVNY